MTDEECVRSVWENVREEVQHCVKETPVQWHGFVLAGELLMGSGNRVERWSAAAEFTRDRREEVRQLHREIDEIDVYPSPGGLREWMRSTALTVEPELVRKYARDYACRSRTVYRLESELTKLTAGMKEPTP